MGGSGPSVRFRKTYFTACADDASASSTSRNRRHRFVYITIYGWPQLEAERHIVIKPLNVAVNSIVISFAFVVRVYALLRVRRIALETYSNVDIACKGLMSNFFTTLNHIFL